LAATGAAAVHWQLVADKFAAGLAQDTGRRLVKHARYYWLLLAKGQLTRGRFGSMLRRIAVLPLPNE
jgi:hypothetical protein